MKKEVLIIGADDSNHAGDDNVKGEINVATFSFSPKDAIVREFSNNRNYQSSIGWMNNIGRDYRFAILQSSKYRRKRNNLVEAVPILAENYLDFLSQKNISVQRLEVYLDGPLLENERAQLVFSLKKRTGIEDIIAKGFVKKRKGKYGEIIKCPNCPPVVYHADTWANMLFSKPFDKLMSNERLVTIL